MTWASTGRYKWLGLPLTPASVRMASNGQALLSNLLLFIFRWDSILSYFLFIPLIVLEISCFCSSFNLLDLLEIHFLLKSPFSGRQCQSRRWISLDARFADNFGLSLHHQLILSGIFWFVFAPSADPQWKIKQRLNPGWPTHGILLLRPDGRGFWWCLTSTACPWMYS